MVLFELRIYRADRATSLAWKALSPLATGRDGSRRGQVQTETETHHVVCTLYSVPYPATDRLKETNPTVVCLG